MQENTVALAQNMYIETFSVFEIKLIDRFSRCENYNLANILQKEKIYRIEMCVMIFNFKDGIAGNHQCTIGDLCLTSVAHGKWRLEVDFTL